MSDDFDYTQYMEMPTPCPRCGDIVEHDEMWAEEQEGGARTGRLICKACHERERDDE